MSVFYSGDGLSQFYAFFQKAGTERLNGLGDSYFSGLNSNEKIEAWNFLKDGFALSEERIRGLYILDKLAAIELFKYAIKQPIDESAYPAALQANQINRILMLSYICENTSTREHLNALAPFSNSPFVRVRTNFAQMLPVRYTTVEIIESIKAMVFTETERAPLSASITKIMAIYGMEYAPEDPVYKSIYLSLRSDKVEIKKNGIAQLEKNGSATCI